MIKRLVFFLLIVSAMALAGCDSESDSILEDPVNVNVVKHEADEGDTELEKLVSNVLVSNVGYYYGYKPNLTLFEFAYRAAGQYCIFPKTDRRNAELEQLSQQEGSQVIKLQASKDIYIVSRSRGFITDEDFVSDRYFAGYYTDLRYFAGYYTDLYTNEISHDYIIIDPSIGVWVYDPKTKDKILKDYKGKLTLADHEQGKKEDADSYFFYFDCHFNNAEQVLNLANKIFLRSDVKFATANMLAPIHKM